MVIALAGRRIDAPNATEARFPPDRAAQVATEIRAALEKLNATAVVCSAACGADILALEAAGQLKIPRRVILPLARDRFRETSVADRPGDWGSRYDLILNEMKDDGEKVVLLGLAENSTTWTAANEHILMEAEAMAHELGTGVRALVVWEGKPRSDDDVTAHFKTEAERRDIPVTEIISA
jgi:hypothetical protein